MRRSVRILRSRKGGILLSLMIVAGVLLTSFTVALDLVSTLRQTNKVMANMVLYRAVLDSALDYTIYGIKQRWCFSNVWDRDPVCNMAHARSVERLIHGESAIRSFEDLVKADASTPHAFPVRLDSISHTVSVSSLGASHPLFQALEPIKDQVTAIHFEIIRRTNVDMPTRGDETTLRIRATLISPSLLFKQLNSLSAESEVMFGPRELSHFTLIVPRDMRMEALTAASAPGDANFQPTGVPASGTGLIFESPVFVNRNVHLPVAGGGYTPVTFASRLYIGSGKVFRGATELSPTTPGGIGSQLVTDVQEIGGFLGGLDFDNDSDRGLEAFISATGAASATRLFDCREHLQRKSNLEKTSQSQLVGRRLSTGPGNTQSYRLGLSQKNMFRPQTARENCCNDPAPTAPGFKPIQINAPATDRPRVRVRFQFGNGQTGYADIGFGGTTAIKFGPSTSTAVLRLRLVPVTYGSGEQPHLADLQVEAPFGTSHPDFPPGNIRMEVGAYDMGSFFLGDNRKAPGGGAAFQSGYERKLELEFTTSGGTLDQAPTVPLPAGATTFAANHPANTGPLIDPPNESLDMRDLDDTCSTTTSDFRFSFGPSAWGADYSSATRVSWNFAIPTDPANTTYASPATPEYVVNAPNQDTFHIASIQGTCRIQASAERFFGFLACDRLIIDSRSTPLLMIGTIVAGSTNISSAAVNAGIRWRSIHHPQSILDLRQRRVLRPFDRTATCPEIPTVPVWAPNVGQVSASNLRFCNAISLRDRANPFRWTTVDPDCGMAPNSPFMACKRRPVRFLFRELSRVSDL